MERVTDRATTPTSKEMEMSKTDGFGQPELSRRQLLRYLGVGGLGLMSASAVLAACADDTQVGQEGSPAPTTGGGGGTQTPASGRTSIDTDITVSSYPVIPHAVVYLMGFEEGIFEKHGWNIGDLVGSTGGGTTVRNVVVGNLPVGEVAAAAAIVAWGNGAPINLIAGSRTSGNDVIFVTRDDVVHESMEDMRGRKAGYTNPASGSHAMLALTLDHFGLSEDVETVATGGLGSGLALLDAGDIDYMLHLEILYNEEAQAQYKLAWKMSEFLEWFQNTVIITGNDFLAEDEGLASAFLDARSEAVQRVKEDPEKAAALWAQAVETDEQHAVDALLLMDPDKEFSDREFSVPGLENVLRSMELMGQIDSADEVPMEEILDQRFIPEEDRISI